MRDILPKCFVPTLFCLLVGFICLILPACTQNTDQESEISPSESGRTTVEAKRIICAAPSVTEIVFALGIGERVVGISDFSTYPPEVRTIPRIGGLINPNKEKITSLQPDLLIIQGQNESLARFCREHKIRFLSIEINSLEDIWAAIHTIGQTLRAEKNASALIQKIKADLQEIKGRIHNLPPKKVFLTLGHTPGDLTGLMTTGPGTFLHELVSVAGGENIFSDATGLYPQISKESLVKRQPEVIIEALPGGIPEEKLKLLEKDWLQFPMLPAVQSGNIHYLTEDFLLIPSVRIAQTVRRFAKIFHPEAFRGTSDA
ncbi:MAG: ABC transporter substrate-binding protein [Candidatus Aminicenantes bacterium]|nr:ABC transporter substrate-binding protein [Candidatus Aminicenantes bacterium]